MLDSDWVFLVCTEMAPMLQGKMFLIAGLLDAVPMIGVGIAMYILFVIVPSLTA